MRVAVTGGVEPDSADVFSVSHRAEQPLDQAAVASRTCVGQETVNCLDGWRQAGEIQRHASGQELWHSRWKGLQPDVSFDVDGDGVVSSEDLLVAREFDKDGNGMLDGEERRELRRALAKTGIETYYALPKGPPLRKAQTKSSLLFPTPREAAPTDGIDPDSDAWHFRMDTLHQKTRTLQEQAWTSMHSGNRAGGVQIRA